ncbi:unnamed protein product, partial [Vitis vinifera]
MELLVFNFYPLVETPTATALSFSWCPFLPPIQPLNFPI